jgi:hypothetical protein
LRILDLIGVTDRKLDSRIQSEAKRKEPGILNLVKQYNGLCQKIDTLIGQGKAPRGALRPTVIDREGLFKLDVDDDIWQDIGLQDALEGLGSPLGLTDHNVQEGIRLLLELDRCMEEEGRLQKERCAMQEWLIEEWECLQAQIASCGE